MDKQLIENIDALLAKWKGQLERGEITQVEYNSLVDGEQDILKTKGT